MPEFFTEAERTQLAAEGLARPDGSYPIRDARDLTTAAQEWERAGHDPEVATWIRERARALRVPNPARRSYNQIIEAHASRLDTR